MGRLGVAIKPGLRRILTTKGDILHRSAGDIARLAIGADNQILRVLTDILNFEGLPAFASDPHGAAQHSDVTRYRFYGVGESNIIVGSLAAWYEHVVASGGANLNEPQVSVEIKVPDDFVSSAVARLVWVTGAAAGNMSWLMLGKWGSDGEAVDTHVDAPVQGETPNGGASIINVQEPEDPLDLSALAIGDYLAIKTSRIGSDVADTLDSAAMFLGILFSYTAEQ